MLNTRSKTGDLTGTLIADLVLQILAYVAQTEREFIKQRQAEGIAAAKANGKHLGRAPIALPEGFEEVCCKCLMEELTITEAAELLGMARTTFYRKYKEYIKKLIPEGRLLGTYSL